LVELLTLDGNPKLQFESCWTLTNIVSGTTENTRAVIEAGSVPLFVRLLDSPNEDVREQAVWALGNIAGDTPDTRKLVLQAGIIQPLLRWLLPSSRLSFVKNATWTISNLCRGKYNSESKPIMDETARALLPRLASLVTCSDKEVLTDALWALSYLSDGDEERLHPFLESGCLSRVVELISHEQIDVVTPALRTVGNVVSGDDLATQAVINENTLHSVARLISQHTPPTGKKTILKESCWLVSNVCAGTQRQIQAVMDANIMPLLIKAMDRGIPEVVREACWALSNATMGGNPRQVWVLVQGGIVPPFHDVLKKFANHPDNGRVHSVALDGLENILSKSIPADTGAPLDTYKKYLEDAGVPSTLCKIVENFHSSGSQNHAQFSNKCDEMLHKYWPNWDEYDVEYNQDGDYVEGDDLEDGQFGGVGGDEVGSSGRNALQNPFGNFAAQGNPLVPPVPQNMGFNAMASPPPPNGANPGGQQGGWASWHAT